MPRAIALARDGLGNSRPLIPPSVALGRRPHALTETARVQQRVRLVDIAPGGGIPCFAMVPQAGHQPVDPATVMLPRSVSASSGGLDRHRQIEQPDGRFIDNGDAALGAGSSSQASLPRRPRPRRRCVGHSREAVHVIGRGNMLMVLARFRPRKPPGWTPSLRTGASPKPRGAGIC